MSDKEEDKKGQKPRAKKPPERPIQSLQMDLFSTFLSNDPSQVSNSVEMWEIIPKYFFTPAIVERVRTDDGLAGPYRWPFYYRGRLCAVRIQPAFIDDPDGVTRAHFPGPTEELVEEALKRVLAIQSQGLHDIERSETWVRFTLRVIQRELRVRGKTRSIDQIKRAIEVMSRCVITVTVEDKEVWSGAILQDLVTVDREEYLGDTEAQHVARLPLFITYAINQIEYRQYNYDRLMSCKEQLTRWIYKRLVNRFKQASMVDEYHFMYSDLRDSGLLQQGSMRRNRTKVEGALEELVSRQVLMKWQQERVMQGRKVIDVKFVIAAHRDFIGEQKAANKRQTQGREAAKVTRLPTPVDKLI